MNCRTLTLTALAALAINLHTRADITTGLVGYYTFDDGSGSQTATDFSGNNNLGTLTGFSDTSFTSMWTGGYLGGALLFNTNADTGDYVAIPNAGNLNFTGPNFTMSAWVNCSVAGGSQVNGARILTKGNNGADCWDLGLSGGKFYFQVRNGGGGTVDTVISGVTPVAGTWYHVVGVYNRTSYLPNKVIVIYVNGVGTTGTGTFVTTLFANTDPVTIGNGKSTATSAYNLPFKGVIDEVHLYGRALAPADVAELYANSAYSAYAPAIVTQPRNVNCYVGDSPAFGVQVSGLTPDSYQWQFNGTNIPGGTASVFVVTNAAAASAGNYSVVVHNLLGTNTSSSAALTLTPAPAPDVSGGLAGWWKFDDATGSSSAADFSGNSNPGTLAGFVDLSTVWTNGWINGGLAFNGDAGGLDVVAVPSVGAAAPANLDFSASPAFTLTAWVNGSAAQAGGAGIIAKGTNGGGEQYVLEVTNGAYCFYVVDTNLAVYTAQTPIPPNGGWQHLAAVLNATNGLMECYVNGLFAASAVAPFSLQTNSQPMSIGNRQLGSGSYGYNFTGLLDDVRVYGRSLSSADIQALYDVKPAPVTITGPLPLNLLLGASSQLTATASGGVPPYTYQWQRYGTNIPGATSNTLALNFVGPTMTGPYDLIVYDLPYAPTATSGVVSVTIVSNITFNTTGIGWTAQGNSSPWFLGTNVLRLTDALGGEANSAFYNQSTIKIGQFAGSFTYQFVSGTVGDGVTFCIQNDPRGPAAIGSSGGGLGVAPGVNTSITPSVEFEININKPGVSFNSNGGTGPYVSALPVVIGNNDPIFANFTYDGTTFSVTLTDSNVVPATTFTISTNMNIPGVLGTNAAWVGFTGGDGSTKSVQIISNFTFRSLIDVPPSFVAAPQSITNLPAGLAAVFSASLFGSQPFNYQWQLNGTNLANGPSFTQSGAIISGATSSNLVVNGAQAADAGTYTLVVGNGSLPNASASATLTINNAPVLESQPATSLQIFAGARPALTLGMAGRPPFSFQWTSNGIPITGATNSVFTITAGAGSTVVYGGTVTNAYGSTFISPITATILAAPTNPYPAAVLADHPLDYWRLNESSGTMGFDYLGGNNGTYTNAFLGQPGYTSQFNPQTDPGETAVGFGGTQNSYMGWVPPQVNFGAPANSNAEFSVEAWVSAGASSSNAAVVCLGYGNGGEQFCLDLPTVNNVLRFFVRNAAGTAFAAQSSFFVADGAWHHVVGVCDEANAAIYLYADGRLVASGSVPANSGLLASANSLAVGARQQGAGTQYNFQLNGSVDEVAVYNYPLASNQVLAHYYAAGIKPANLQIQPLNLSTNQNQNAAFASSALGTPPLYYLWYDINNASALISTNPVLNLSAVQASDGYLLIVSNLYGTVSSTASLNVNSGPVSIPPGQLPSVIQVPPGYPLTLAVGVVGTAPFAYQWYLNTTVAIPGATNSVYSFTSVPGTNTYTLWATNQSGGTQTASSSPVVVEVGATPAVIGFGDGTAWQVNGGALFNGSPAVLQLTDGLKNEARSAFYSVPQYIAGFVASFTYIAGPGNTANLADGVAFTLQNSPNGLAALGANGGGLGYLGITPSVALELDLFNGSPGGTGINWETNGLTAGNGGVGNGGISPVNLASTDPIAVSLFYNDGAGQLNVTLTDQITSASYRTNYHVGDLAALLGSGQAYVGFTGSTGGSDAVQSISNFVYSYSQAPALAIVPQGGGAVLLSWPAPTVSTNFVIQQSSTVNGPWSNLGAAPAVVGNQEQISVNPTDNAQFYRLILLQ